MDLKHCEFITGCSSLVDIHGCLFKAMATKHFSFNEQRKMFCSHGLEKTSMDTNEADNYYKVNYYKALQISKIVKINTTKNFHIYRVS